MPRPVETAEDRRIRRTQQLASASFKTFPVGPKAQPWIRNINGAGAAGIRIADMIKAAGVEQVILCDSRGVVREDRTDLTPKKREHAVRSRDKTVGEALRGAHVLIGVSIADCIRPEDLRDMADYPAVFAMANPVPEIRPEVVAECMGDQPYVMATGRSDYPNQINNVLVFPFLFKGALDARASTINLDMKIAASKALVMVARQPTIESVKIIYEGEELEFGPAYVIPKPFDRRLFVFRAVVSWTVPDPPGSMGTWPSAATASHASRLPKPWTKSPRAVAWTPGGWSWLPGSSTS